MKRSGIRGIRLLAVCALLAACLGCTTQVYAKHTAVGKAASQSYVKTNNKQQVIIYVGDSRVMYCTCGTKKSSTRTNYAFCFVNGGNVTVINRSGGKLTPFVKKYIQKYKKYDPIIVFNFGLNGNGSPGRNAKRIIKTYRSWMKAYPDLRFYVESIGPTILKKGSYSNPKVIRLNNLLKAEYEPKGMWLDTYSYILENGLISAKGKGMRDNYHYKWKTSKKLLVKIRELIEDDITASRKQDSTGKQDNAGKQSST